LNRGLKEPSDFQNDLSTTKEALGSSHCKNGSSEEFVKWHLSVDRNIWTFKLESEGCPGDSPSYDRLDVTIWPDFAEISIYEHDNLIRVEYLSGHVFQRLHKPEVLTPFNQ
jgi:hypothetical protein